MGSEGGMGDEGVTMAILHRVKYAQGENAGVRPQ
jgi:hypothetical protein